MNNWLNKLTLKITARLAARPIIELARATKALLFLNNLGSKATTSSIMPPHMIKCVANVRRMPER